jgi:hypothetical protein
MKHRPNRRTGPSLRVISALCSGPVGTNMRV